MTRIPDNCIVRLIDLPPGVGGVVCEDESGFYNIYINARYGIYEQRKSLRHELRHLRRNDLHNDRPIKEVEGYK